MNDESLQTRLRVPLDRFDLEVDAVLEARVTGLFGPSGSGKTTWLETIAGLRRGARGRVRLGETVWLDSERGICLPPERRGIGYVPQDQRLFPHLDVRRNLLFGARRAVSGSRATESRFDEAVRILDLGPLLDRGVADLSGGERQRVAIGRALCSGPALLMLDEPLASLDLELRHRVLPYLARLRESLEAPMIVVSHQPFELQALCGEVFALREGKVVAHGTPADVFTHARVFGAIAREGYQNVFEGIHASVRDGESRVRLGSESEGLDLISLRLRFPPGERVTISIPAGDILIAAAPVAGISARNQIAAEVIEVRETMGRHLVMSRARDAAEVRFVAELTAGAVAELGLAPRVPVNLIIKSSAIAGYDRGSAAEVAGGGEAMPE